MSTVALAGVSARLGLIILDAILAKKKHSIVVLSRTAKPELTAKGVDVRIVEYTSHPSVVGALKDVHTLLSVIGSLNDDLRTSQLALLAAAKEAGVKRFAPSEYATSKYAPVDAFAAKGVVWDACLASGLECAKFTCGIFTNTLGTGTPKNEEEALGGLRPWTFIIDMLAGTADIPGDGNAKATFTRTADIGKFVAAALDLPAGEWREEMGMEGSRVSYNEIVKVIEKVQRRKMLVRYSSEADLNMMIQEIEGARFYNQVRLGLARGEGTVPRTLNELFPAIKPWTVEEYVQHYWGGVEVGKAKWGQQSILA